MLGPNEEEAAALVVPFMLSVPFCLATTTGAAGSVTAIGAMIAIDLSTKWWIGRGSSLMVGRKRKGEKRQGRRREEGE